MILLDENIPESQKQLLKAWRLKPRQIGGEIAKKGVKDEAIIPLLHRLRDVVLCTRDLGFYRPGLCHPHYCIVCLDVGPFESASFIRRVLRHPEFKTKGRRSGKILIVTHHDIRVFQAHSEESHTGWSAESSR
jgi:hypothetical protein